MGIHFSIYWGLLYPEGFFSNEPGAKFCRSCGMPRPFVLWHKEEVANYYTLTNTSRVLHGSELVDLFSLEDSRLLPWGFEAKAGDHES